MEVRVLGPVKLIGQAGEVRLAAMPRRLLAALVFDPGKTRTVDVLIDALWAERPPRDAAKVLQLYVSRLRKALPEGARILTDSSGYALELDEEVLDATRFERLLAEARKANSEGNPSLAVSLLGRALWLWQGQAFGELAYEDFARAEAERLEELRLLALEEQSEAQLRLGRHAAVVGQLSELGVAHPQRERMQAQLMVALYRSGRQTEALDVYTSVRLRLRDELALEPGEELRDLQRRILQHDPTLAIAPVSADHPPALPAPPNRLLGRGRELGELRGLLLRERVRLLVLTGAGGSGKTRLALEAARETADFFANGACLVELAPLRDPELVPGAIARALALKAAPGEEPFDTVAEALRSRELLLVLDNAEHLRVAAPLFPRLLAQAPRLSLLVTSRAVLHLSGEHVYPVEPLPEPDAVALFSERAREADPRFQPTSEDEQPIRQICRRLDGLPLALELAAGRTRTLTPRELLDRLERRLPILTGGPRDLPARQQTLRATLEWSYGLLDEDEQRDLRRLAVFVGGCTLEAAEAVCDTTPDRLATLVEHNLLQHHTTPAGSRYTMLETIREFAVERGEESGEADELRRRHAAYFVELFEGHDDARRSGRETLSEYVGLVRGEQDNARRALAWYRATGSADRAARLAVALHPLWVASPVEGRRALDEVLMDKGVTGDLRARALWAAAIVAGAQGDFASQKRFLEEARPLLAQLGDRWSLAEALRRLGGGAIRDGQFERAGELLRESERIAAEIGDRTLLAAAAAAWAHIPLYQGDYEQAEVLFEEALQRAREAENPGHVKFALTNLGLAVLEQGRLTDAVPLFRASLAIRVNFTQSSADAAIEGLAAIAVARGDTATAARLSGQLGSGEGKSATRRSRSNQRFTTGPPRLPGARSASTCIAGWHRKERRSTLTRRLSLPSQALTDRRSSALRPALGNH